MKKSMALMLALVLLLCSFAMATAEESTVDLYQWKYDEPVKASVISIDHKGPSVEYDASNPAKKSVYENVWVDAYKEYLNLEIERICPEDYTALNALLNTGIASQDLPDIMFVQKSMFYVLAENGVLKNLEETYQIAKETMPGQAAMYKTAGDALMDTGLYEGERLGIPMLESQNTAIRVLWIRKDWLDALGMVPPTTVDELCAVAQAFKDAKLGGENTIGIEIIDAEMGILEAYGAPQNVWIKNDEGVYEWGAVRTAEVSKGLLKMQEMYKAGLFKSDFAVSNLKQEEISNGQSGIVYGPGYYGSTDIKQSLINDRSAEWIAVSIPTADGQPVMQRTNTNINYYLCVNKNYENPDALFRMLELEYTLYEKTPSTELYNKYCADANDNNYQYNLFRIFKGMQGVDSDLIKYASIRDNVMAGTPVEEMPLGWQGLYRRMKNTYDGWQGNIEGYDRTDLGLLMVTLDGYRICKDKLDQGLVYASYNGPITENMSLYEENLNTALKSAMLKVILGEDISVYEKAVDTWYQNRGQVITDEVNAYYASIGQ